MPDHRDRQGGAADPRSAANPQGGGVPSPGPGGGADSALETEAARRKLAEQARQEAEAQYRNLVENSEDLIFTHDLDGVILSVNPAMVREIGYASSELLGRPFADFLAEETRKEFSGYLEAVSREGHAHGFLRIRTRSGEERALQHDSTVGREAGREVVRGIAHDVQRRWAERALRLSVSRLEALLNNIPDLAWLKNGDGRYSAVNESLARYLGRSREEVIGRRDSDLFPRDLASRFEESDRRALRSKGSLHTVEEIVGPGRAVRIFDTTKTPIRDVEGRATGTVGIARDVTERRRLEEQLLQAQKMEAIGRLAGGVAHDFNNLLTTILGYCGILLDQLSQSDPLRADLEEIQKAGERAAALTQQLLTFSRKQVIEPAPLDLNAIVSDASKMLQRLIGEDIELVTRLEPGLGAVRGDPGQIHQVLINLAINARDAMPEGGTLSIETRSAENGAPARQHPGYSVLGQHVLLSVTDSGVGMDAETRRQIFEPFFTTKERGKGTGLGLATVYGIVKQSGGEIWVESESGRGASFTIAFPRTEGLAAAAEPPRRTASPGSETILLVEDEEAVRRLAARVLASRGYEVLAASGAAEAGRLWERDRESIRVLITDVVMPGRGGRELARQLLEENPDLIVIFISGYTDSPVVDRSVLGRGTAFLQKPFTPEALTHKVRQLLDGAGTAAP